MHYAGVTALVSSSADFGHAQLMDRAGDAAEVDAEALWRRRNVPENEAPVSVAFDATLLRTDEVAVFLSGLRVYRNGMRFTIEVRTRTRVLQGRDLHRALHDQGPAALLIGIELADGRRCVYRGRDSPDPTGPLLIARGGGGSYRSSDLGMYLSPLPPAGPTRLWCAWPWLGIGDQATLLPTDEILAAAANVIELWPWEPEEQQPEPVKATPDIPADSWFFPQEPAGPR